MLALPVGCPTSFPKPVPGRCATPAPPAADGMWERCVRWFRAAPGALLEPWSGCGRALGRDVPGDGGRGPGTAAARRHRPRRRLGRGPRRAPGARRPRAAPPGRAGLDPAARGRPGGVVDFDAVLARLDALGYAGLLSVEYFDLPEQGWPLADPRGRAIDLAVPPPWLTRAGRGGLRWPTWAKSRETDPRRATAAARTRLGRRGRPADLPRPQQFHATDAGARRRADGRHGAHHPPRGRHVGAAATRTCSPRTWTRSTSATSGR